MPFYPFMDFETTKHEAEKWKMIRTWKFERALNALSLLPQEEQTAVILKWGLEGITRWQEQLDLLKVSQDDDQDKQ